MGGRLSRTIYRFGPERADGCGHLVLRPDGVICADLPLDVRTWILDGGRLRLLDEGGAELSRLEFCPETGGWQAAEGEGHEVPDLRPALSLDGVAPEPGALSFLVNSIPKAGTYFLDAALRALGNPSLGLHLIGRNVVDDYRGVPEADMHKDPLAVRHGLPTELVAPLLEGQHVVGHIEDLGVVGRFREQGVTVLTVVRDLRDVVASLFRFKLAKVAPRGMLDMFWRDLDGPERLAAFLMHYHVRDLLHIRMLAEMIIMDRGGIVLRYEDMRRGHIAPEAAARLDVLRPGLSAGLAGALRRCLDRPTSTYAARPVSWRDIWTDSAEKYFAATGMTNLNRALGY